MVLVTMGFLAIIFYVARQTVIALETQEQDHLDGIKHSYHGSLRKIEDLRLEKKRLEEQAEQTFTLFEMTREITKNFNLEEAFQKFKQKLGENVYFEDCQFFESSTSDLENLKISSDYLLFSLHSKERKLGLLAIRWLWPQDKEKVLILTHQFALALRRITLYEQVEQLALTDSLTDVHTRRYFWERFEEELRRAQKRKMQLSFLMLDVDNFKKFNDQYGHMTGDRILNKIGSVIKESVREIDIAGRYGGEEFSVVLPDTGVDGAKFVAERIRTAVENTLIKAYDHVLKVSISIGIATFPKDAKEPQSLVEKADMALYRAKEIGRNCTYAFGSE